MPEEVMCTTEEASGDKVVGVVGICCGKHHCQVPYLQLLLGRVCLGALLAAENQHLQTHAEQHATNGAFGQ